MDKGKLKEEVSHGTVSFPLAVYQWKENKEFVVKLHWHEETELIYFKKGSFLVDIDMKRHNITGPAFLLIDGGSIHSILGQKGCVESAVVFDLKMLSFEYFDGIQYKIIRPLLEKKIQLTQFIFQEDPVFSSLQGLYKNIIKQAENSSISSYILVKSYLYQLIALLYQEERLVRKKEAGANDSYQISNAKKVLSYIHESFGSKIRTKDMADLIGMNPQYFCRYFKKLLGKTPTEYINEVRIEKAAEYLKETDMRILDIALSCGYENTGYFIKRFTEAKHMTPSAYRKQAAEEIKSK